MWYSIASYVAKIKSTSSYISPEYLWHHQLAGQFMEPSK